MPEGPHSRTRDRLCTRGETGVVELEKLIIQVRVNEGQMRNANPHVHYSPEEIADQVVECWRAGASVVHYHAREPTSGKPSTDADLYAEVVRRVKKECDIITFPTLGASMLPTVDERIAHIVKMAKDPATKPDCVPADMLTSNLDLYDRERKCFRGSGERVYLNTTRMLQELCQKTRAMGVKPVAMMWNIAGIRLTQAFIEMELFEEPLMCEFTVFGEGFEQFGHPATTKGLQALMDFIPQGAKWHWMVSAIGTNPFPLHAHAIANGGHVAIGLGDYPYPELGYPTNAQLVGRVVELAKSMGREVAGAAEARRTFGFAR
jgi:3-keto-5-aminohexanoate cleavage enzyme